MDGRQEKRHSSEVAAARERRSKRTILKRTVILMLLCGVGLFVPLFLRLWDIAIVHHEDYQRQATGSRPWTCPSPPPGATSMTATATCWPCRPRCIT